MVETEEKVKQFILIAIETGRGPLPAETSLSELAQLLETAGGQEAGRLIQPLDQPVSKTYFGKGKLEELKDLVEETKADGVIADDELSPAQLKNIGDYLGCQVLDRTSLILEIFAARAKTREGQLQVEMAQLKYRLSRLSGVGASMSRQGGGAGLHVRGAGETKLELDRRNIRSRIAALRTQLDEIEGQREIQRGRRQKSKIPMVALVGYTNAGKSTIFNRLTEAGVLEEDQLFATLDTTTRRIELPSGRQVVLADTVGFIQNLPHHLVEAFHATLEEVAYADLLVHVVDASDEKASNNMKVTMDAMSRLHAGDKPIITVFNKSDLPGSDQVEGPKYVSEKVLHISAFDPKDLARLTQAIEEALDRQARIGMLLIPYTEGGLSSRLYDMGTVMNEEYREDGICYTIQLKAEDWKRLEKYKIDETL